MAKQRIDTSKSKGGSFEGELSSDVKRFFKAPNQWTHARNAVNNTIVGDIGDLSNEMSNYLCTAVVDELTKVPLTIIGAIHIDADEWAIFSTNDTLSAIGLFKEDECYYKQVVSAPCLNFSTHHLIKGVGRTAYNCRRRVYWDDGLNPTRVMDLDKPPFKEICTNDNPNTPGDYEKTECTFCEPTTELDCDKIRLAPLIQDLAFRVAVGNSSGQIINGSYFVVGAYLVEGQRVTDYSLPSNVQGLFAHDNVASALDIYVEEADPEFDEFELIIVQFANYNTVARRVGVYSTRQKKITLDFIDERWATIDYGLLLIQNPVYEKTDALFRAGEYILRVGPTTKFDFNYQPLANQIKVQWTVVEYPSDYYRKGGTNVGYLRDEVYAFFIRWVYNTGDKSRSYHIPGRALIPGVDDAPEINDLVPGETSGLPRWKVYNTASLDPTFQQPGIILPDGGELIGRGDMAYWESSEIYDDDNPQMWNASDDPMWGNLTPPPQSQIINPNYDLCGKHIRHHKFPDNALDQSSKMITNHYNPTAYNGLNGEYHVPGSRIRVLGIQVSNIKPPLDNYGNVITNIVGYEILRGSREGNKTVLAKGMINNLREYAPMNKQPGMRFLYPNYPYNPTAVDENYIYNNEAWCVDHFLSATSTGYNGGIGQSGSSGSIQQWQASAANNAVNDYNAFLENDNPLGVPTGTDDSFPGIIEYFNFEQTGQKDNIMRDMVTFHSPETNFREPFLSSKELKIYGELQGTMVGNFQIPDGHPKHKFITDTAFVIAGIVGLGYAILSTEGEKTTRYRAPQIQYGGTKTDIGTALGTTGLFGGSAISAIIQLAGVGLSGIGGKIVDKMMSHSMLSTVMSALGIDPNGIRNTTSQLSGFIGGAIGGQGGETTVENTSTGWASTPLLIRMIGGIPSFLTFWAQGTDKILELIYAFVPYRQFALQQVSHCYYDKFAAPDIQHIRRGVLEQVYLNPGFQDFATSFRINNLFRPRTVALQLHSDLKLPNKLSTLGNILQGDGRDNTQAIFSDVWSRDMDYNTLINLRWENEENVAATFTRHATSHYAAIKQRLDNQYGQLPGIMQVPVSTNTTELVITYDVNGSPVWFTPQGTQLIQPSSPILFNGDTYIGRYTEKNTMFFFYDWLNGQPDGSTFNYKLRQMVPHPRFWMDTDHFDSGEFVTSLFDSIMGQGAPVGFDPFMVADPTDGDPDHLPQPIIADGIPDAGECNCQVVDDFINNIITTNNCYFGDASHINDLEKLCELMQQIDEVELWKDYVEDCACFRDTGGHDDACNEDQDEPDPWPSAAPSVVQLVNQDETYDDIEYIFIPGTGNIPNPTYNPPAYKECPKCVNTECNAAFISDTQAKRWSAKDKGKVKRLLKRADRKIKRLQKKMNKIKDKLYEDYMDDLDGNDENNQSLADKLVLPHDKFAFDMRVPTNATYGIKFAIREAYMYLFNSGVRDFYVESEINIDYRDWGEKPEEKHYDHIEYTNLKELFSTDRIKIGNYMKYDYSLSISKLFSSYLTWGLLQDRDYDPYVAEKCYIYRPKRVIYSLPQHLENKKDNWRVFLPLNYKDFTSRTVNIKAFGKNGAIMLFENESPIQIQGVDTLETDAGVKLTIGDGGLFSMPMQNLVNVEYSHEYGSCQDRLSVANTPAGLYYMSQNQGKIFQVTSEGLREISMEDLKWWFFRYLPYQLTQHPTAFLDTSDDTHKKQIPFDLLDNPVAGIGCQTIYDNINQIVYFCKKDWVIRDDIGFTISYLHDDLFLINELNYQVTLGDPRYFRPASWTVSWDPKASQGRGSWISYHDWHPDLTLPTKHTFMTTKDNGMWIHADRCDSYCNFYGIDYPFEVEFALQSEGDVNTLRSVLYLMETYIYDDNCYDRFHDLDFNFDEAIIHNSEQCSGLLKLNLSPKNNAPALINYPHVNFADIDILYSKEEQKYRFNQFWDITADRGEYNPIAQRTIFLTEPNGYIRNLNPANLNYTKNSLERKKFRHYKTNVLLRRKHSGNRNMIISVAVQSQLNSPR